MKLRTGKESYIKLHKKEHEKFVNATEGTILKTILVSSKVAICSE